MSLYRTTVALAIKGSRVEKNTEVELTKEDASIFDTADLVLVGSNEPEAEEPAEDIPLEEMSHAQLKDRAKELGLAATGTKADLQERIELHLAGNADAPSEEQGSSENADAPSEEQG